MKPIEMSKAPMWYLFFCGVAVALLVMTVVDMIGESKVFELSSIEGAN